MRHTAGAVEGALVNKLRSGGQDCFDIVSHKVPSAVILGFLLNPNDFAQCRIFA